MVARCSEDGHRRSCRRDVTGSFRVGRAMASGAVRRKKGQNVANSAQAIFRAFIDARLALSSTGINQTQSDWSLQQQRHLRDGGIFGVMPSGRLGLDADAIPRNST